jgi:hypothetical protein
MKSMTRVKIPAALILFSMLLPIHANATTREKWMKSMEEFLPKALCNHKYFKACFKVTQSECFTAAKKSTHKCLQQDKKLFPKVFDGNSGSQWGAKVGTCTGGEAEKMLSAKKVHDKKCDDPSAWTS